MDAASSPAGAPKDGSVYPPNGRGEGSDFEGHATRDSAPATAVDVVRLKRRAEFLAVAATGRRWIAPSFVLQTGRRLTDAKSEDAAIGLGFTATRRIGNAVARNRAKRRLREAARRLLPDAAVAGHDYVLIARAEVLTCAFQTLLDDLERAFSRVLTAKPRPMDDRRSKSRSKPRKDRSPSAS
ncbi:MAG: ribonuclease P protein component [Pseudomonadota bacterium]